MAVKSQKTYGTTLVVADYKTRNRTNEQAFDHAGHAAVKDARRAFRREVGESRPNLAKKIKIVSVSFIEFDSYNISHAGAYFDVVVEATDGQHKLLRQILGMPDEG